MGPSKTTDLVPRLVYAGRYLNTGSLQLTFPNFPALRPTQGANQRGIKRYRCARPNTKSKRKGPKQKPAQTNIKGKRIHRRTGLEWVKSTPSALTLRGNETTTRRGAKQTPNANQRKGQTKPPQTRNSQNQRRRKRPNRNQPQTLGPCRKNSIVLGGAPPHRPRVQVSLVRVRVSVGRYVFRRIRLIFSFVRAKCCFRTFLLAAVSFYPFVGSP